MFHGKGSALRMIRPDGSELHDVFPGESIVAHHPDMSPDGNSVAYASDAADGTTDIWIAERDPSSNTWIASRDSNKRRRLVDCQKPCGFAEEPAWSPDGTKIAYTASGDGQPQFIKIVDSRTGEVTLTVPAPSELDGPIQPRWSPDGRHLAVEDGQFKADAATLADNSIGIIDLTVASPSIHLITPPGMMAGYPGWSPTGDIIVFQAGNLDPLRHRGTPMNLYTIRPDGTALMQITHAGPDDPWFMMPTWTTSGGPILVTLIPPNFDLTIATMNPDGSGLTSLASGAHPRFTEIG